MSPQKSLKTLDLSSVYSVYSVVSLTENLIEDKNLEPPYSARKGLRMKSLWSSAMRGEIVFRP